MPDKYVLGINLSHNGSACLLKNGVPVVAVQEERLTRKKNCTGFERSVKYCLSSEDIFIEDVAVLAVCADDVDSRSIPQKYEKFELFNRTFKYCEDLIVINHHLGHAASAYLASGFEDALVAVIDGCGSGERGKALESFYTGKKGEMSNVETHYLTSDFRYSGLGLTYAAFTHHLGFDRFGFCAGKVMGLSAYGDPERFTFDLYRLIDGHICADPKIADPNKQIECSDATAISGLNPRRESGQELTRVHKDMAARLQKESEIITVTKLKDLLKRYPNRNLCYAGGFALNGLINSKIFDETDVEGFFVPPAANDAGCSFGAALFAANKVFGQRLFVQEHDYFGIGYDLENLGPLFDKYDNIFYELFTPEDLRAKTAELLSEGKIVGWFQGKSEFGPRALGNRSILADPRDAKMKDKLNSKVKHREDFRPFAPVVLSEFKADYFIMNRESPFMLEIFKVNEDKREVIPAVVHVDGTARVQTLKKRYNPKLYSLISEFQNLTGVPVLLNTSFNVQGDPIVETPKDALDCFLSTGIDYLIIGDFIIQKR